MSTETPMVFVLDDDASVRDALTSLFRSVGLSVQSFASVTDFLGACRPDVPQCLVLDVRLPGASGLELQRQLAGANSPIPIIFITGHGDIPMSVQAMRAGALEFLTKPFRDQDLLDAVQKAIENDRLARQARAEMDHLQERFESLSIRERQVMGLAVRGLLNKQIAAELAMTEATVKVHRARLMRKMQADSFAELVRMAEKIHAFDSSGSPV